MTPKRHQGAIKANRGQQTFKRGPKISLTSGLFGPRGAPRAKNTIILGLFWSPQWGQNQGVGSQDAVDARIGGRGGVGGGVGGEVQNKICTDLGQLFCTPGPSKRGAADSRGLRHSADPNGSRLESLKSKESKER
jgi:hypothetical protein